jgi:hypothetical protein
MIELTIAHAHSEDFWLYDLATPESYEDGQDKMILKFENEEKFYQYFDALIAIHRDLVINNPREYWAMPKAKFIYDVTYKLAKRGHAKLPLLQ